MSIITALGADGESLIYLEGEGAGTYEDPFRPKFISDGGTVQIKGLVADENNLPSLSAGVEAAPRLDNNGILLVNQKALTETGDKVRSFQGGTWTVELSQTSLGALETINVVPDLAPNAATASNQTRIPGLNIPEHDRILIREDATGEMMSTEYTLNGVQVCLVEFNYSDHIFVEPYRTTTITKS